MEQEVQFVDPLVDVPVAAHPGIIYELLFNLIQPVFRAVIYRVLVDHRQESLNRFVLVWAGMGEHHIDTPVFLYLLLHIGLDCFGRLLIRPPPVATHEPIILVHTIGAADNQMF